MFSPARLAFVASFAAIVLGAFAGLQARPETPADVELPLAALIDVAAPDAPVISEIAVSGTSEIIVRWGAASDDVGVARYLVEWSPDGVSFGALEETEAVSFADRDLPADATLHYRIIAIDGAGHRSAPSVTASAHTPGAPAGQFDPTAVNVAWQAGR